MRLVPSHLGVHNGTEELSLHAVLSSLQPLLHVSVDFWPLVHLVRIPFAHPGVQVSEALSLHAVPSLLQPLLHVSVDFLPLIHFVRIPPSHPGVHSAPSSGSSEVVEAQDIARHAKREVIASRVFFFIVFRW